MIDAHAVNESLAIELEYLGVGRFENAVFLLPERDQIWHIEEAPPVDRVSKRAPPRQAVMLSLQQLVQRFGRGKCCRIDALILRPERQHMVEITEEFPSLLLLNRDLPCFQRLPARLAENGEQNLAVQHLPIDVE